MAKKRAKTLLPYTSKKSKRKRGRLFLFGQTAFITAVFCLFSAMLLFCAFGRQPVEEEVQEEILQEKPKCFSLLLLLPDGFSGEDIIAGTLLFYAPEDNSLTLCSLPARLVVGGKTLLETKKLSGGKGVLAALASEGIFANHFFSLSLSSADGISKRYGNLYYTLAYPLSYYDPATGDSFLAAKGLNAATGSEFCRLADLSLRQSQSDGSLFLSALLADWFSSHFPSTPTMDDLMFFYNCGETDLSYLDLLAMEKTAVAFSLAKTHILSPHFENEGEEIILTNETKEALKGIFAR